MRILAIPDIHLKPWIFDSADRAIADARPDEIVVLGDLLDDFGYEDKPERYTETLNRAGKFMAAHPYSYWCIGNHEIPYVSSCCTVSGTSLLFRDQIAHDLLALSYGAPITVKVKCAFLLDGWIFTHAGLAEDFVQRRIVPRASGVPLNDKDVVELANDLTVDALWEMDSPLWYRPSTGAQLYGEGRIHQCAGHTPSKRILEYGNLVVCDTFSTYRDGVPIGDQTLCLIDTADNTWRAIPAIIDK